MIPKLIHLAVTCINTVTNALNNDLKNVSDWLTVNKLSLNTKKTEYMIIGSYQRLNLIQTDPPIYLGTEKIELKRLSHWV
jgi:hypothetical protein